MPLWETPRAGSGQALISSTFMRPPLPHPFSKLFAFKVLECWASESASALQEVVSTRQFPGVLAAGLVSLLC